MATARLKKATQSPSTSPVTNSGPGDATNVDLTDLLPTGLTATALNGGITQGSYDAATGLWTIGDLANGASATLTIEGTVDAGQGRKHDYKYDDCRNG